MFKRIVNALLAIGLIAFPFVYFFGRDQVGMPMIAAGMALLWACRLLVVRHRFQAIMSILAISFFLFMIVLDSQQGMYWYPVLVSTLGLCIFGSSLWRGPSFVERLARLTTPNLPEAAIVYTRKVTWVWVLFFVFNITVTSYLIVQEHWSAWAWYTGVMAYVLMGILGIGEWCIRQWVMKK